MIRFVKKRFFCLFCILPLLLSLALPAIAAETQAAAYQSVYGIKVEFTPSPRTGRYRFELYGPESADPLCSKLFDSIAAAQTVFLPVECQPGEHYTIRVTALPEPGREGLDVAASKEQEFMLQPVCGHTAAEGAFFYGSGTANDPYIVSTPAQLRHLDHADHKRAGQYFLQSRDIDLLDPAFYQDGKPYDADNDPDNGNWVPIAKEHNINTGFLGYYDGGGHTLYNLTYYAPAPSGTTDVGVFGYLGTGGVENLGIENFLFSGQGFGVGGIAGVSHYTASIKNCRAINGTLKGAACGGIAGYFHAYHGNLTINDCYSAGIALTITTYDSSYHAGGGIAGYLFCLSGHFARLQNTYSLPNTMGGTATPGAIVGNLLYDTSYVYGSVSDSYYLSGTTGYGIGYPASNSGAAPLSEAAFADESSFPGWDFTNTWTMGTVTYTDASGSERTVTAPVLRVFERTSAQTAAKTQRATPLREVTIGLSR